MKTIVKVRCDFELDGRITPLLFRTQEGPAVRIDRVLDVRPAASTRDLVSACAIFAAWADSSFICSTTKAKKSGSSIFSPNALARPDSQSDAPAVEKDI